MTWDNGLNDLILGTGSTTVAQTTTTAYPTAAQIGAVFGQTYLASGPSFYLRNPTMYQVQHHPAFQAPVSELVDLWRVKYGSVWVTAEEILKDEFYEMAAQRLKATGHLECHTIIEPNRHDVFKLVE